jgi:glycosyltransferase involved in cell wall biosynthesis
MKIKIVYLIGQLGLGGSERQLYLLLKHMDKTKFEPHVIVFNPSENYTLDNDLKAAGVPVYEMPPTNANIIKRVFWLAKTIKKIKPHILHSWTAYINAYVGVAGRLAGVKVLLGSVRGALHSPGYADSPAFLRWLILHGVHGHLVNADTIAEELRKAGVPEKKIYILFNCVETPEKKSFTLPAHIPPNARLIGMVGNLRYEKNYPLFIYGLAGIVSEFENVYGVIAGQSVLQAAPDLPEQIKKQIADLKIENKIWLAGFQADVPALLSRFEIFCLTSNSEGTPNALLEAMVSGLPAIATRVGGIPQIVENGVSGIIIAPNDLNGLQDALRFLLENPEAARKMGAAGRQQAEQRFSIHAIVPLFENYYLSQTK